MEHVPIKKNHPLGTVIDRETAERLKLPCIVVPRPPLDQEPEVRQDERERPSDRDAAILKMEQELKRDPKARTARRIMIEVALEHHLTLTELLGTKRSWGNVDARYEAYARCHDELGMSTVAIGKRFGRDHSSIVHGIRRHRSKTPRTVTTENLNMRNKARRDAKS
jgi:hypothetical protein